MVVITSPTCVGCGCAYNSVIAVIDSQGFTQVTCSCYCCGAGCESRAVKGRFVGQDTIVVEAALSIVKDFSVVLASWFASPV